MRKKKHLREPSQEPISYRPGRVATLAKHLCLRLSFSLPTLSLHFFPHFISGTLQEILLLRRLTAQSKTSGIDLVRLNKGEEKKRKKKPKRKDGDPEDPAEDEAGGEEGGETYGLKQSRAGRGEGGGGEGEE